MRLADELDVSGKRVLVRCDLNVPLEEGPGGSRTITDDGRIRASVPLLQDLLRQEAKVVGWYDNEWGYSNRLVDLVALVGRSL